MIHNVSWHHVFFKVNLIRSVFEITVVLNLVNLLQMWDFYILVQLAGHHVHPHTDVLEKHPTHVLKLLKES